MEWLAEFMAAHPRVRLDFLLSDAKADLIAERIDVAIRGGALDDSDFIARQIHGAGIDGLVASPACVAAHGAPSTLQELTRHDCLGFAHPSGRIVWRLTGPGATEEGVQVTGRFSAATPPRRCARRRWPAWESRYCRRR